MKELQRILEAMREAAYTASEDGHDDIEYGHIKADDALVDLVLYFRDSTDDEKTRAIVNNILTTWSSVKKWYA